MVLRSIERAGYRDRELLIVINELIIVINGTVEMRSSG